MNGGLFVNALLRELGHPLDPEQTQRMQVLHGDYFAEIADQVRPLPGASDLLHMLTEMEVPWAIATSGHMRSARHGLDMLGVLDGSAPIVTRDLVRYAKSDPDLFLAAAEKLGHPIQNSWVISHSIWDLLAAQRARALGISVRSSGYGGDELREAGASRSTMIRPTSCATSMSLACAASDWHAIIHSATRKKSRPQRGYIMGVRSGDR